MTRMANIFFFSPIWGGDFPQPVPARAKRRYRTSAPEAARRVYGDFRGVGEPRHLRRGESFILT